MYSITPSSPQSSSPAFSYRPRYHRTMYSYKYPLKYRRLSKNEYRSRNNQEDSFEFKRIKMRKKSVQDNDYLKSQHTENNAKINVVSLPAKSDPVAFSTITYKQNASTQLDSIQSSVIEKII